jgi:hypothetical protein
MAGTKYLIVGVHVGKASFERPLGIWFWWLEEGFGSDCNSSIGAFCCKIRAHIGGQNHSETGVKGKMCRPEALENTGL